MLQSESKTAIPQFIVQERAVLYARVSGDDTRQEGRNLKGQLNMGREHATQKGYCVIAELAEDDRRNTSGADWDLPELNKALEMARNGEFDVLTVRELDRFARDLAKQLVVESQFKGYGVRIEYVLGEYPNTPEGNLNKNIKAVIAEYERLKTRERMIRGKNQLALSGKVIPSDRIPYGYRLSDGRETFVICPEESKVVKLIFELYTQDCLSIRAIAQKLTELKILTAADKHPTIRKKRKPGQWSASTVAKILKKKAYTGVWTFNKENKSKLGRSPEIEVPIPAIISQEMFNLAQARLLENKKHYRRETKYDFILNRRCTCGLCGAKAATQVGSGGRYLYYKCPARTKNERPHLCNLKKYNAHNVDTQVWQWLRSLLKDEKAVAQALQEAQDRESAAAAPLGNRLEIVKGLLKQYDKDLDQALKDLKALEKQNSRRAKIKKLKEIDQTEKALDSLEAEQAKLLAQIEAQHTLTDEAKESLLSFALKIGVGLEKADDSIELRREAMETFNVQVTLTEEDGELVFYAICMLQVESSRFVIVPDNSMSGVKLKLEKVRQFKVDRS